MTPLGGLRVNYVVFMYMDIIWNVRDVFFQYDHKCDFHEKSFFGHNFWKIIFDTPNFAKRCLIVKYLQKDF